MNICVKCACIAAALAAVAVTVPKAERWWLGRQGREALCEAARQDYDSGDALALGAQKILGSNLPPRHAAAALEIALFDYAAEKWKESDCSVTTNGRIAELLHQHPGEPQGS